MRDRLDRALGFGFRALLFAIGSLPQGFAREFCAAIASLYARFGGPRVADARVNLEVAFPERSRESRERILIESFANLGRSFAEMCLMYTQLNRRGSTSLFDRVSIEGREHLDRLEERSGDAGALVLTAHLGSWELCAAALARQGLPISVVQHGFENRHFEKIVTAQRERSGLETLALGGAARGMFRALARGRYIALLMDQNASREEGVFAPFFSRLASTRSGPVQLAMTRETPLIPVFFFRVGKSGDHVARIGAPLVLESDRDDPDKALVRNVERINATIEAAIREAPEQWIWSHRRFKTQPPGASPIYPPRRSVLRVLRHWLRRTR
jgi:KDO2-lipid IV(A) lauroyltransferase